MVCKLNKLNESEFTSWFTLKVCQIHLYAVYCMIHPMHAMLKGWTTDGKSINNEHRITIKIYDKNDNNNNDNRNTRIELGLRKKQHHMVNDNYHILLLDLQAWQISVSTILETTEKCLVSGCGFMKVGRSFASFNRENNRICFLIAFFLATYFNFAAGESVYH